MSGGLKLKIELADHLLDKKAKDRQDKEKREGEILENIARLDNDIRGLSK